MLWYSWLIEYICYITHWPLIVFVVLSTEYLCSYICYSLKFYAAIFIDSWIHLLLWSLYICCDKHLLLNKFNAIFIVHWIYFLLYSFTLEYIFVIFISQWIRLVWNLLKTTAVMVIVHWMYLLWYWLFTELKRDNHCSLNTLVVILIYHWIRFLSCFLTKEYLLSLLIEWIYRGMHWSLNTVALRYVLFIEYVWCDNRCSLNTFDVICIDHWIHLLWYSLSVEYIYCHCHCSLNMFAIM